MNNSILNDNQARRLTVPIPLLVCYSLFTVWQMGVVFFTGTALSLDGKTPLPVNADNITAVIVAAYILSIIYLIFFQRYSVVTARVAIGVSLAAAGGLFLPLPDRSLAALVTVQIFCCVFMIGISISIVVGLFTEKSEMFDILITAVFANILIAVLQNDTIKIPFTVFRVFTVIALAALLLFFFKMPAKIWPQTIKKRGELKCPLRFTAGIYILIALSCMLTLFGNAVGESIPNGVSVIFVSAAVCGAVVFALWKLSGISPLRCTTVLIGLSAVGFVLALAGGVSPAFMYIACALLGCGCPACALTSFYGIVLFKRYPSRFVAPFIITLAVITVVLHSVLLEAFRHNLNVLYVLYAATSVLAAFMFLMAEPSLIWSMKRGEKAELPAVTPAIAEENTAEPEVQSVPAQKPSMAALDKILSPFTVDPLSGQELRVAELILGGYTNAEMAEILGITINTVKSYRKNLYEKLQVHSRRELFSIVNYGKRE